MPSRFPTVTLPPLKGLNLKDDAHRLTWGECVEATNVIIHEDGSADRVDGYTNLPASSLGASYCASLFEFERWDGSIEQFFEYSGTLYKKDPITHVTSVVLSGLTAGARIGYVPYNDYLFFGNGFDECKKMVPVYRHYSPRAAVATADATALASVKTLANALKADMNIHIASTSQHSAADATNTIGFTDLAGGDTQATTDTACNELKTDFNAHRSQSGVHPSNDGYHLVEAADASDEATSVTLINQIKLVYNQHIGDGRALKWCITAPTSSCTVAVTASSGLGIGAYNWVYTHYNVIDGTESPPSPLGTLTTTAGNQRALLSAMQQSTDPQVTHKRIYRTVVGGSLYYRVAEITNRNTTYTDSTTDALLGTILLTLNNSTVPVGNDFLLFNDRIYMSGDPANPYRMTYTEALYPEFYNAGYNFFDFDTTIKAKAKVDTGIMVFELNKSWFLAGTSPFNFSKIQLSAVEGCTNANGLTYVGKYPMWISTYGVRQWDGATMQRVSDLIDPQMLAKNLNNACMVYDAYKDRVYLIVASS